MSKAFPGGNKEVLAENRDAGPRVSTRSVGILVIKGPCCCLMRGPLLLSHSPTTPRRGALIFIPGRDGCQGRKAHSSFPPGKTEVTFIFDHFARRGPTGRVLRPESSIQNDTAPQTEPMRGALGCPAGGPGTAPGETLLELSGTSGAEEPGGTTPWLSHMLDWKTTPCLFC